MKQPLLPTKEEEQNLKELEAVKYFLATEKKYSKDSIKVSHIIRKV